MEWITGLLRAHPDAGVITIEKGTGESVPITKQTLTRFQAQEANKHIKNYFSIKNNQANT